MATAAVSLPAVRSVDRRSAELPRAGSLEYHIWLPRTRQCVFNAWTIPEYIELWNNTDRTTDVRAEVDLRRGSSLLVAQNNGSPLYRIEGSYISIHRPERIVLTWSFHSPEWNWDSLLEVDFTDVTGGTMLGIVQSAIGRMDDPDRHTHWWQDRLDRLMRLMA